MAGSLGLRSSECTLQNIIKPHRTSKAERLQGAWSVSACLRRRWGGFEGIGWKSGQTQEFFKQHQRLLPEDGGVHKNQMVGLVSLKTRLDQRLVLLSNGFGTLS